MSTALRFAPLSVRTTRYGRDMGIGAVLIILGIIVGLVWSWILGIILILLGLLFGGFRRGRWY